MLPPLPGVSLGNGEVSRAEFAQGFTSQFGGTADQANKLFGKLDKDGSGDISIAEIEDLFKDMDQDSECLPH